MQTTERWWSKYEALEMAVMESILIFIEWKIIKFISKILVWTFCMKIYVFSLKCVIWWYTLFKRMCVDRSLSLELTTTVRGVANGWTFILYFSQWKFVSLAASYGGDTINSKWMGAFLVTPHFPFFKHFYLLNILLPVIRSVPQIAHGSTY